MCYRLMIKTETDVLDSALAAAANRVVEWAVDACA